MVRIFVTLLIYVSLFFSVGCESLHRRIKGNIQRSKKNINYFIEQNEKNNVNRVLIMPIKDLSFKKDESVIHKVYETISFSIATKNYFEVVKYEELDVKLIAKIQDNLFAESNNVNVNLDILKELKEKYSIDAVLFSNIKSYRSYQPMSFGYKQYLISTSTGNVIWVIDDILNMAERNVNTLAKNWYYKNHEDQINPSLHEDIMDISFDNFLKFSFNIFIETWEK